MRKIVGIVLELADLAEGGHGTDALLPVVDEITKADKRDLMSSRHCPTGEANGRIVVLLGGYVVDYEGKLDLISRH